MSHTWPAVSLIVVMIVYVIVMERRDAARVTTCHEKGGTMVQGTRLCVKSIEVMR